MIQFENKVIGDTKFVNLCPHEISVMTTESKIVEIPQSGLIARVKEEIEREVKGLVQISRTVYRNIYGLPEKEKNVVYIVSSKVLNALNDTRSDVVGTGVPMKNGGKIACCLGFRRKF